LHTVALFGPTAVGKTEVAIELAELLRARGENPFAISADTFQVYEGLDVLTAKPSADALARLEHRLVSCVPVEQSFSVAQFAKLAHAEVDVQLGRGRTPIVVGGTGLYLRAALTELDLKPRPEPGLREQVERELVELGAETLHRRLGAGTAGSVHPNDRKRIVRALELELMGERPYTASEQLWSSRLRRPATLFGLVIDREVLAERISARVDTMLEGGAIEEVERALERCASPTARKAIGFAEIEAVIRGELDRATAGERIKRRQRQYARRQLTWMRKLANVELVDRTNKGASELAASMLGRLLADARPA
jgi:tRNA dimethylallyltransferase